MPHRERFTQLLFCFSAFTCPLASAQSQPDSVRLLEEVVVEAYGADRPIRDVPASIQTVTRQDFSRFGETSPLSAFNMLPGIRMEERSPGSYRFSIRGSLLRSPFGIRNVKFYWNGLPFTDGGGNTYFNLIDLYAIQKAEVIKGPAGSMYGAGTGGAVLLRSPVVENSAFGLTAQYGSFGALRYGALMEARSEILESRVQFVRQQSDGYRDHSGLKRNAFNADMAFIVDPSTIVSVTMLYSDLHYETPGGLTEAQFAANPQQARPATPSGPGAVDQRAAVNNKTTFSGINAERQWSKQWSSTLGFVASSTDFENPAIRNFETRKEENVGLRLTNRYEGLTPRGPKVSFGGEYQRLHSPITVTNNAGGVAGAQLISSDEITTAVVMGFSQVEMGLSRGFELTAGLSLNYVEYQDRRQAMAPSQTLTRKFNPVLLPRLALLKRLTNNLSAYLSASKGYSPPSVAEVVPSTGIYNPSLDPETGWSYEVGLSGKLGNSFDFHLAAYDFRLRNAIVLQRDSSGADYFVNAGDVSQQGIECNASWTRNFTAWISTLRIISSITYSHYRFGQYVNDGIDFSGNAVTGVPPLVAVVGADVNSRQGWYLQVTGSYADRIPLNDANTSYASDYLLIGARCGLRKSGKIPIDLFVGVDNVLNQRYSLGNDLNAAGGRYYNAAPTRNYYVGLTSRVPLRRPQ